MRLEDALEAAPARALGEPAKATVEEADPARLRDQAAEEDHQQDREPDDDEAEVRLDQRIEIDPGVLPPGPGEHSDSTTVGAAERGARAASPADGAA